MFSAPSVSTRTGQSNGVESSQQGVCFLGGEAFFSHVFHQEILMVNILETLKAQGFTRLDYKEEKATTEETTCHWGTLC